MDYFQTNLALIWMVMSDIPIDASPIWISYSPI